MMTSKKKYALGKTGIKVASKSEVIVGQTLLIDGYRFVYDKKYPYEDIDQQFRFDFMILNASDTEEEIKTKHHLFIEVKDDDKDYLESLEEKRKMVNDHDDMILVLTDKDMEFHSERITEAMELMSMKADYKRLKFENNKLKELLRKNGVKY